MSESLPDIPFINIRLQEAPIMELKSQNPLGMNFSAIQSLPGEVKYNDLLTLSGYFNELVGEGSVLLVTGLSGYFELKFNDIPSLSGYIKTGDADLRFYPLNSNPSGYTSEQQLNFIEQSLSNKINSTGELFNNKINSLSGYINSTGNYLDNKIDNINHNNLLDIQGGATGEYFHLTSAQSAEINNLLNNSVSIPSGINNLSFDISSGVPLWREGRVFYDVSEHTLAYYNDNSEVTHNIGQETWIRVRNNTDSVIQPGKIVYINGALGNRPTISLANCTGQITSRTIGMTTHPLSTNEDGYITAFGLVHDLNTNAYNEGDAIYVSQNAGEFTTIAPTGENYTVPVGIIVKKHATQGVIFVNPDSPLAHSTESSHGVSEIATQSEVNLGLDDERIVTSLKLSNILNSSGTNITSQILSASGSLSNRIINSGITLSNIINGLSGQSNINYATIVNLIATGQQLFNIAQNNSINLSGQLFLTGSNLVNNINLVQSLLTGVTGILKNVQSDWNSTSGDSLILNKPVIPSSQDDLPAGATYTQFSIEEKNKLAGIQTGAQANVNPVAGNNSEIQFNHLGNMSTDSHLTFDVTYKTLKIGNPTILPNNPLAIADGIDAPLQVNVQNKSSFNNASTDYIATTNDGTNESNYIDLGINSSTYNDEDYNITEARDGYLLLDGSNLAIGTSTSGKHIKFHAGGTTIEDLVLTISETGLNLKQSKTLSIGGVDITQSDTDRHSVGLVSGGIISKGSVGTINISAGIGWALDNGKFVRVSWNDFINQPAYGSRYNYVHIYKDGTLFISDTEQLSKEYIRLGHFFKNAISGVITIIWNTPELIGDYQRINNKFLYDAFGTLITSGIRVTEKSSPKLQIDVEAGTLYSKLSEFSFTGTSSFYKLLSCSGLGPTIDTDNNDNTINTTIYNNIELPYSGALVSMTSGYWAKGMLVISPAGQVTYVYPQSEYPTEDGAKNALLPLLNELRSDGNAPLASVIYQKGDISIANSLSDIRPIMSRAFGTEVSVSAGVTIHHGSLIGLNDDDHAQYLTSGRAELWFNGKTLDNISTGVTGQQFTIDEKIKLASISTGAKPNVQADWNSTTGDSFILNKPVIPTSLSQLSSDSNHRTVTDLEKSIWSSGAGTPATSVVSQITYNQLPSVGVSLEYARADHTHGTPPEGAGGMTRSQVISTIISFGL